LSGAAGIALAVATALGVVGAAWPRSFRKEDLLGTLDEFVHEKVLALSLLALPFIFLLGMKIFRGGMVNRYVVETALGFSLAMGCILPRLERRSVVLAGTLLLGAFAMQEAFFWRTNRHNLGKLVSPSASAEEMVSATGRPDLPVVVSDGHEYFQFAHYVSRERANRYVALDSAAAIAYAGSDTIDKELPLLRSCVPMQVYEFQDFAQKYPQFLLYSSGGDIWDWWPARLLDDNYTLELVRTLGDARLYLATKGSKTY